MVNNGIRWLHHHQPVSFVLVMAATVLAFWTSFDGIAMAVAWGLIGVEQGWRAHQQLFVGELRSQLVRYKAPGGY